MINMDQEHELHCRKCYNYINCIKLNSLKGNEPNPVISCPIVQCRFKCKVHFHACKEDEHILLCENIKVPCINVEYGCGLVLERKKRAKHLETCPASVIVCKMEWNRWPLADGEKRAFDIEENKDQLDVAFLKHDEKTLREWEENLPKKLRKVLRTALTEKHPAVPLGISGRRIPYCIATDNLVEKLHNRNNSYSDQSERDESSSSHAPAGLASSVCKKLVACSSDNNNNKESLQESTPKPQNIQSSQTLSDSLDQSENDTKETSEIQDCTRLSLVLNIIPKSKMKPRNIYTFMCAQEFRRDEFPSHFHQVHSDIASHVDGWIFRRCPMETVGCGYGIHRLFPHDKNYRLVHNNATFCPTQITSNHPESDDPLTPTQRPIGGSICDMPFEVLVHLTRFLDPLSLGNLSMTCTFLRDVCEFVVEKRGIVALQWEKVGNGWEVCSKKWLFSTAFSPIRKWSWNENETINNHMQTCTHFDKTVAKEPFSYTNGMKDIEIFDAVR